MHPVCRPLKKYVILNLNLSSQRLKSVLLNINNRRKKWLVSKETLCCVGGQVKQLVDYQLEVDKGKLTAVANLKS